MEKGPSFCCPNCLQPVTLKKGQLKIAHFAHKPPRICTWASGETHAHMSAKRILRDAFVVRGLTAVLEAPVLSTGGDRRADVLVTSLDGSRSVAIEVQHQPLDYASISTRTAAYMAAGVPVIWVALLNDEIWAKAEPSGLQMVVERFSVRPWQRWAHAYGMAELWFLDVPTAKLWKGRLTGSLIHVEYSTWHDSYGNEESAGGYDRFSKKWKTLTLSGPYDPAQVLLDTSYRKHWSNKQFSIPAGQMARFVTPSDPSGA